MNCRLVATRYAFFFWLLATSMGGGSALAQDANAILSLAGRWAGSAILVPTSGPDEPYTCVATYFPSQDGSRVQQNLRCKSANYRFDGATHLQIAAGKITGRWQDKVNNLDGIVNGTLTADGFDIFLTGNFFDAKMTVVSSSCQQSVTMVLEEGLPIKKLSALLKKC
jgi:hypothetical protein